MNGVIICGFKRAHASLPLASLKEFGLLLWLHLRGVPNERYGETQV